nr:hypothetical protein [Tanacetum cinerariifolium]
MGFSSKWRCWINSCLDSAYASVLINGSQTKEFKIEKGIRQGDPLSPFLFILAVEALNVVFLEARNKRIFLGAEVGIDKVPISHLQFADDALIIGQWALANAKNLSRILTCFHLASGLKVNFNKSKLFGIGVSNYDLTSVSSSIGCQPSHLHCVYLGLPIGANRSRLSNWSPLVERIQKWLSNRKSKSLSYGGRLTLLKSVLGNLGVYFFSTFKASTTATRFWLDPWIGGPLLCESFPRLFWLESNSECMVIDRAPRPTAIVSPPLSFFWAWSRPIRSHAKQNELQELNSLLSNLCFTSDQDTWECTLSDNRLFTVKSLRRHITTLHHPLNLQPFRWNKILPIKINISTWRIQHKRLPTRSNLDLSGIDLNSTRCPVCDNDIETDEHLFISCNIAKETRLKVLSWCNIRNSNPIVSLLDAVNLADRVSLPKNQYIHFDVVVQTTLWVLCKFKNEMCFSLKRPSKDLIFNDIKQASFNWISCVKLKV